MTMRVPLLDLKPQYQSIKEEVLAGLHAACDQQQFILGPAVERLEQDVSRYCGTRFAVGVSSGTDALLLALMAIDIQPGDRIITTPYTFFATVGSICRLGAMPLFVDIDAATYNIDPDKLPALVSSLDCGARRSLKAIMPVHLFGQCADMQPLLEAARQLNLTVIEDAAQAIGASCRIDGTFKKSCSLGNCGCLSFFPSKNLGCFGDGGMITTSDEAMAHKLKSLRVHGQVQGYHHKYIGINGRLDAIQAAVLLVKLPHLDAWIMKRQANAACYARLFTDAGLDADLTLPSTRSTADHVYNQFVIRAPRRDELKRHLESRGVGCAVYYPVPLHLQECFQYLGYRRGDFPEAERAACETLALPIFPELGQDQIEYVVAQIRSFYRG